jgi:phosphoglucosamine mutase
VRRLFGTDGIRGIAGEYPLDDATIRVIGRAIAHHLGRGNGKVCVVIGQDTRESSPWIAAALTAGLVAGGAAVDSAGVMTTPGIAFLARTRKYSAGVVISASHNPWLDNGIKLFGPDGYKLPDALELEIEHEIFSRIEAESEGAPPEPAPNVQPHESAVEFHREYAAWLAEAVRGTMLGKLKMVADCANGAASAVAPEVLRGAGVAAEITHAQPDGRNINEQCGALHPEVVAREVKARGAELGVCFDGDADRALFADRHGRVVNGDAVLLLCARDMKARGRLRNDTVVATTMSNMGLEIALRASGIRMLRAPVGDKYVLEEMRKTGATLGGEQSGHLIFRDGDATTGDGLLTALRVLDVRARAGKPLDELIADLKVLPQIIENVRVREKKPFEEVPEIARAIRQAEQQLDGNGRVVVRYSGTEALARVMVEAESEQTMRQFAENIAGTIRKILGV